MRFKLRTMVGVAAIGLAAQAAAQITFYEGDGFSGRSFTAGNVISNFAPTGFNDRARSAIVEGGTWQVCEHADFQGRCVILGPGRYDLTRMDMYKQISSVRPADYQAGYNAPQYAASGPAYQTAPGYQPGPAYQSPPEGYRYHRRPNEQIYEVPVTSVHAVVGPPEQRCWVERQQAYNDRQQLNVPGAIIGGVIGGVLGHQVGGGRGRDVATAAGAVGGAAIGANVGRGDGGYAYDRDVQRCENVSGNMRPDYWDVTYNFRGIEHRVQLSTPPGPTIAVNADGEPRG